MTSNESQRLEHLAERALELVPDGGTVGLGTGHAATAFVHALAKRVAAGLRVRGVPTSQASADLAERLGIPLATLEEVEAIDVDVDGADEVDPQLNLIKGYGGALVREKVVAACARRLVILVGSEKCVDVLGARGILPVEVLPFAAALCRRELTRLGCIGHVRRQDGQPLVTDNGNWILDCHIQPLESPGALDQAILAIPGVVGTGLFLGMQPIVLVDTGTGIEVRGADAG